MIGSSWDGSLNLPLKGVQFRPGYSPYVGLRSIDLWPQSTPHSCRYFGCVFCKQFPQSFDMGPLKTSSMDIYCCATRKFRPQPLSEVFKKFQHTIRRCPIECFILNYPPKSSPIQQSVKGSNL